jgi:RNA polymerase sigma-70 factor (ECF subfamily)
MSQDRIIRTQDDVRLRALMVAYQGGHLEAVEQLHALLAPPLMRWLRAQTRDAAEAEDLVQEAFLQIHRARHTYDPSYPVAPWAYAIARHVWLMHRRARLRRPRPTDVLDPSAMPVRAQAEAFPERADLRAALDHMPRAQRKPVVWHHVFGLSFREIAARLGIRESAAKLRSSRGMADLRRRLRARQESDDVE